MISKILVFYVFPCKICMEIYGRFSCGHGRRAKRSVRIRKPHSAFYGLTVFP